MQYVIVRNLIKPDGNCDYKGLDINRIVAGSQLYPDGENCAYLLYDGEIPEHPDIELITAEQHDAKRQEIRAKQPKDPVTELRERLELVQAALDDLILGGAL